MMTIGSLFSGIGGLELGLEMCGLGPVLWQAESDPYARGVLAHHWPGAITYTDVRRIDEHTARVDIICGGFPCQDISVAGKGAGLAGKRSGLWSEFARTVRVLRPRVVFVENVAALRRRGLDRVLGDLAACGFDAEWGCFRASDVGAPHIRERLFLLAHADRDALRLVAERIEQRQAVGWEPVAGEHGEGGVGLANPASTGLEGQRERLPRLGGHARDVADADGGRREVERSAQPGRLECAPGRLADGRGADGCVHSFPPGPGRIAEWDGPQPAVRRGAHGLQRRVDRLRALGNAVIPQVAALAFRALAARAIHT